MRMTVSKRFEFAASHRYFDLNLSAPDNRKKYGQKSRGDHGHGHNYVAFLIFEGAVDGTTGMLVNISIIKERILGLLARRFDHKYLNVDSPPFDSILPTPENIARQMLVEAVPLFDDIPATPTAVYLEESNHTAACAFTDGRTERILRIDFSAARRTFSPHLNDDENEKLFGAASRPAGHGHHYYLWVTLESVSGEEENRFVADGAAVGALEEIRLEFDHRNLNVEIDDLRDLPITTEMLAGYVGKKLRAELPVRRVRLSENDRFVVDYSPRDDEYAMGIRGTFSAAHRLNCDRLSPGENLELYGKCNNPAGHGHQYRVEALLQGKYDARTGTLFDLAEVDTGLQKVLSEYDYHHLDLETSDFNGRPSTGENIVSSLWLKLDRQFRGNLKRLRLWETNNNRFSIRR